MLQIVQKKIGKVFLLSALCFVAHLFTSTANAQTTLVSFDFTSIPSSTSWPASPWTTYTTLDVNYNSTGLVRGSSVAASGTNAAGCYGGSGGWNSSGTDNNGFAFTITTTCRNTSLAQLSGRSRHSATGPGSVNVFYSLNGAAYVSLGNWATTSTSGTTGTAGSSPLSGVTALQNIPAGTTIKFLFVPQGTTGNWYFTGTNTTGLVLTGTYTVVAAPTVATGPTNSTIAPGAATTFSVSGVSGVTRYQWQRNTSGTTGGTWVNITSATMDPSPGTYGSFTTTTTAATNTLSLNAVPATWNGYGYRCLAINCAGTVNSTPALLTVTSSACGTVNTGTVTPTPTTFCGGGSQLLTLSGATLGIDIRYQWASSPTGTGGSFTNITSATNATYTPAVSATTYYQCTSTCTVTSATATSTTAVISVNPIPTVSPITGGNTMCTGTPLTLSDATTGTHVWSSSNTATATINSSTGIVTGLTAGTTNITYAYTDATTTCTANAVTTVSVNVTPSFSVTPSSSPICAGSTVSLSVLPVSGTVFSENFESTTVGGIPAGWTSGGAGPSFFNVVTAPQTWSTTTVNTIAGSSKYMWVRTASPFNTVATITTPSFSLAGYSAANLSYLGFYDLGTTETLVVQISTSGPSGTFTTIYPEVNNWAGGGTYNTTSFPRSINLSAYVGQPNVAIRWSYTTVSGWAFILDNVSVTGTASTPKWVKSDASFNDLYTSTAHTTLLSGTPAASAFMYNTTPGTYTYYGQQNGCNSPYGATVTVNPMPVVDPISGTPIVCIGQSTSLGDLTTGGSWSSDNALVVTVDATGKITGVSAGTANISYTVTSPFGCSTSVSVAATVNPLPVVPSISGVSGICIGNNATLSDGASFGTWNSDNPPVAAISAGAAADNSDVVVNGTIAGTANISYTLTNSFGCAASATTQVTINSLPVIAGITGASNACLGLTTQLSDATTGGTWSSDNATVASVGTIGLVTGNTLGTANITYTVTSGFGCTDYVSMPVTVNPLPANISSVSVICAGGFLPLHDATSDGVWSSNNANASVGSTSGIVSGITTGTSVISYILATGCYVTTVITVTPTPTASPVNDGPICFGGTVILSANGAGGTTTYSWSGPALSSATVANPSAVPSVTSTYSLTVTDGTTNSGCLSSYTTNVIVNSFGILTSNDGPACVGGTVNLNATSTGIVTATNYSWSGPVGFNSTLQNPAIAGVTTAATGIYTVHATAGSGCSATSTTVVTIKTIGVTASNNSPACTGGNVNLSSGATGTASPISYSWSGPLSYGSTTIGSMLSSLATDMAGTYTMTVTAPGSGCAATATTDVVVNTLSITADNDGPICAGSTIHFTSTPAGTVTPTGYLWNGPTSLPGMQNPVLSSAGASASGTYTVTVIATGPGCSATATTNVLVNTFGLTAGNDGPVCAGSDAHLTATPTGTVTPTAYAWNGPAGYTSTEANPVITGITTAMSGVYTVTTTAGSGCTAMATTTLSVTPLPAAISGSSVVCVGTTITISDATSGGTWINTTPSVASLSGGSTKSVLGLSAGTTIISYVVGAGCTTSVVITVSPAAVITGITPVCIGATVNLSTDIAGGTWSSTNTLHATVDASGIVTGIGNGTSVIIYTLPTGCTSSSIVTVNAVPSGIAGVPKTCTGQFTTLNNIGGGGVWSSSNPLVGTINTTTGLFVNVTGISVGITTISYTSGGGCPSILVVSVNPISPVLGMAPVCVGTAVSLSNATAAGIWSSSNSHASVDGSGNVTGVSAGAATISYTTSAGCVASAIATVQTTPSAIAGTPRVCVGSSATLSDPTIGGTWSSSNTNASVDGSGIVTGGSAGTATISYTLANGCAATKIATVNDVPSTPTGTSDLCAGATATFTDAAAGGTWSSSPASVATIAATSGLLTAVAAGTATITYSTGTGACTATTVVTVEAISPIAGNTTVCIGGSSDLNNASGGGTWSTSDATITIDGTTGMVTGVSEGIASVTYTIPSGCSRTVTITINPEPTPITGTLVVCPGATTSLTDIGSGSWTSGNGAVATVGATTGIVTGVMAGTANITYTAGAGCIAVARVTVNVAPSGIGGPASVCEGSTITETNFTTGGVWSTTSSNIFIDGSGNVTGITAGSATVTYTLSTTSCFVIRTINVNPLPAPISGNTTVCTGVVTFLSNATTGGTSWTSSNASVATVTASGAVTGVASGTSNITYTSGPGCTISTTVTVTAMPSGITGSTPVCPGATVALSDASGAGIWSSNNTAIATVDPGTGVVTGIATGMATITYSTGGAGCIATKVVTVSAANPITGTMSMCQGLSTTLHNSSPGGVWSSTSSIVSVVPGTGVVSGLTAGTALVTYTLTSGCTATAIVTVNSLPAVITGSTPMCAGSGISLGETTPGGTWTSSNTARATVDASGYVTGVSAGTANISYTLSTGCFATIPVTVNPTPLAINGTTTVCVGLTVSLSDATTGGTWSSSTSSASVSPTGLVSGLSTGTSIISYTLSTGCGAAKVATVVDASPAVSGTAYTCVGSSTSLSDATGGGTWTSSNLTVGTVGSTSGIVTGLVAGTTTISYRLGSGCGSAVVVTVTALPAAISGTSSFCSGATTTLTDATAGGTWTSGNPSIATVGGTGIVSGVGTSGTATISYSVGLAGCTTTKVVTVNPAPPAIIGTPTACAGATTALTNATTGGAWTSSATGTATVGGSTGIVTGIAAGTARISYTAAGCSSVVVVTVNPVPSNIGGATSVCQNASITLSDNTAGGTWSSTANASVAGAGTLATVTGITVGTATISYVLPTGCFKTFTETIKPLPTPILGTTVVCGIGAVTFLSDATTGTSWAINPVGTATISPSGRVYGVSFGTATVTYTGTNGCVINTVVTINPLPAVAPITGASTVAHLATITLSDVTASGVWSSTAPTIGSVGSVSGIVTGVASAGTTTISYMVTDGFGCKNAATRIVTVTATAPRTSGGSTVSGTATVFSGTSVSIPYEAAGGIWSSNNTTVATVNDNGIVTGIAPGIADITHVVTTTDGEVSTSVIPIVVSAIAADVRVVPNPNKGTFTVKGSLGSTQDEEVTLEVTDVLGQVIYKTKVTAFGGKLSEAISFSYTLANGMYILNVHTTTENLVFHFVMEK